VKTLAAFVRLPAATRRLALEAALLLLVARLLTDHVPMRWWRHRLHIAAPPLAGVPRTNPGAADASASQIGRIVRKMARRAAAGRRTHRSDSRSGECMGRRAGDGTTEGHVLPSPFALLAVRLSRDCRRRASQAQAHAGSSPRPVAGGTCGALGRRPALGVQSPTRRPAGVGRTRGWAWNRRIRCPLAREIRCARHPAQTA